MRPSCLWVALTIAHDTRLQEQGSSGGGAGAGREEGAHGCNKSKSVLRRIKSSEGRPRGAGSARLRGEGRPPPAVEARGPRRAHECREVRSVRSVPSAVSEVSAATLRGETERRCSATPQPVAACGRRARPGGARRCADPMRRVRIPRRAPLLLALACLLRVRPQLILPHIPYTTKLPIRGNCLQELKFVDRKVTQSLNSAVSSK